MPRADGCCPMMLFLFTAINLLYLLYGVIIRYLPSGSLASETRLSEPATFMTYWLFLTFITLLTKFIGFGVWIWRLNTMYRGDWPDRDEAMIEAMRRGE